MTASPLSHRARNKSVRTQLEPVAKDGDVFAAMVDVAGIVAHSARQVRLHERISPSISSDIRTTDREHLLVMGCFPIYVFSLSSRLSIYR